MHFRNLLREQVSKFLTDTVNDWNLPDSIPKTDLRIRIEYSRDEKFGDYSSPFALENKKNFNKAPLEIANELTAELVRRNDQAKIFQEISVTAPGFINFRVNPGTMVQFWNQGIWKGDYFGELDEKEKINLEFVSANPTGPLNIVSARAAAYGDALAAVLSTLGHTVEKEFYINDYGNQVRLLGVACILRFKELMGASLESQEEDDGRSIEELIEANTFPKESYRGEYIRDIAQSLDSDPERLEWVKKLLGERDYEPLIQFFTEYAVQFNLNGQKEDLASFGVDYNRFFSEKTLHDSGRVLKSLEYLEKAKDIFLEDGKKVFASTKYGDDKDRVVVREDGRPTYLLADIAYHRDKMERGYDRILNIWGPDHHGYIARLSGAMQSMGYPKQSFQVIICQQVNLLEDGKKVKMSKRLGNFQRMRDLIHYLGPSAKDVGRYFFITRTAEAPLDFDLDLAKDESEKNPVFYLQYAHARIASIFREVEIPGWKSELPREELNFTEDFEWNEERLRLAFWISRFSEEVYDAGINQEPHRITTYLFQLARVFTKFYLGKGNRLKDSSPDLRLQLAYLCKLTQICLKQGLLLLGISAPERMESKGEIS
jgi:arginyl-tRNA synthetase